MAKKPQLLNAPGAAEASNRPMAVAADLLPNFGLLNSAQTADLLGISRRTLAELIATREIGIVRIGRSVRFDIVDVRAFIEQRKDRAVGWKA